MLIKRDKFLKESDTVLSLLLHLLSSFSRGHAPINVLMKLDLVKKIIRYSVLEPIYM